MAARSDGTLAVIDTARDTVVTVDLQGRAVGTLPLPGHDCALWGSGAGLYARCELPDASTQVLRETPLSGWTVLRTDPPSQPAGEAVADDASTRWVIAARCTPGGDIDLRALCYYTRTGEGRDVRLPVDGQPVAMHRGTALVVEPAPTGDVTRAALVQEDRVIRLDVPVGAEGARSAWWVGDGLRFWDTAREGALDLVQGTPTDHGWTWSRTPAPPGARRGVHAAGGVALALGDAPGAVWITLDGRGFRPLVAPPPGNPGQSAVDGGTEDTQDTPADAYCAGRVCRLGGGLTWVAGGTTNAR